MGPSIFTGRDRAEMENVLQACSLGCYPAPRICQEYSRRNQLLTYFRQTNPDFSSKNCILSKQTAPSEAVKRHCPNKLNPRQSI